MVHRLEQIHYLIGKIRKGKHISQQVLGRGICSIQQISKIEKGDVSPDFFLTEILLQRLGMSPDKFEIVLSLEEYEEIETRDDIIDDLRQGRPEAAEKRLETFCEDAGRNQPIRQMNRFRLLGALALERGEYEAAEKNLEEAVRLTMGQVRQIVLEERLLAGMELETLILYAQALWMKSRASQAGELLEKVLNYIKKWITARSGQGFRPKLQWCWGEFIKRRENPEPVRPCARKPLSCFGIMTWFSVCPHC